MKVRVVIAFLLQVGIGFSQLSVRQIDPAVDTTSFQKKKHDFSATSIFQLAETPAKHFTIRPSTDSYFLVNNSSVNYTALVGAEIEYSGKKWYHRTQLLGGYGTNSIYTQYQTPIDPLNSTFFKWKTGLKTRTVYHPNDYLTVQAGIDNQFYGEGYRSLIQGDQVAPAPFAGIQVKFLNLEYGLTYQFFHDNNYVTDQRMWKYHTSHYLSWNAFRNFNVTLYECVIYQGKDGSYKRGYEVEYLNPFVFLRPQEYSLGSTDNIIMSLDLSYRIQKHQIYYQLLLDEFNLTEIRKHSGWWGNKIGMQLGVKGKINDKLAYRIEGNLVRPYTYSHINSTQNTGNLGLPIGSYLGSNYAELLATTDYSGKLFKYQVFAQFWLKGFDYDSVSWGGNIYKSYTSRPYEYGHRIGQGNTLRTFSLGAQMSYQIPRLLWQAYFQVQLAETWGDEKAQFTSAFTLGIRSTLFNKRRIF